MDLRNITDELSNVLRPGASLILYSEQTQFLIDDENTLLWNANDAEVPLEIYNELKSSIRKQSSRAHKITNFMSHESFCAALLFSVGYSFNHHVAPSISSTVFTTYWRFLQSMSIVSSKTMSDWLVRNMQSRGCISYAMMTEIYVPPTVRYGPNFIGSSRSREKEKLIKGITGNISKCVGIPLNDTSEGEYIPRWSNLPDDELGKLRSLAEWYAA